MTIRRFARKATGKVEYELWRGANRLHGRRFVHALHIGKTGGTAVKYALEANRVTNDYALILHNHEKVLREVPNGEYVFFFLRDPIARFASGFGARQRQGRPRHSSPWSPGEERAFTEFQSPNELAMALYSQDPGKKRRAIDAMNNILHVNMPYTRWLDSESYLISRLPDLFLIGYQETLSADFARLKKILGLPIGLDLPSDPVAANVSPIRSDPGLEARAIENLKKWYAEDYEILSFCKNIVQPGQLVNQDSRKECV